MKLNRTKELPYIIFLTGASGAGKTTLLNTLKTVLHDSSITYLHFDSVGVPSEEEMIKKYDSTSEWQKAMTFGWISQLTTEYKNKKLIIFEGQVNLDFIIAGFEKFHFESYSIVLVHCNALTRNKRLNKYRNQPELVSENMDNWSDFLHKQALERNISIVDTSLMNVNDVLEWFKGYIIKINV